MNNSKNKPEEIRKLVESIKEASEPISKEIERQLIQLCSCSAAIWNMASSTDPGYLRNGIGAIKDVEQKRKVIKDNLDYISDFFNNIVKSCWIGFPIIEPYLEQATQAYKNDNLDKYIDILQDMHMAFGKALNTCYGAEAVEVQSA